MEERRFTCSLITPLFSYGAYPKKMEFRAAELKGLMRYVYRITCPQNKKTLLKNENILFGGVSNSGQKDNGNGNKVSLPSEGENGWASPVRLRVWGGKGEGSMHLLLHDKKNGLNPFMEYMKTGNLYISLKCRPITAERGYDFYPQKADIDWYTDLAMLSVMLCGLGRRSRKGRGSLKVEELRFVDSSEAAEWICRVLNQTACLCSNENAERFYMLSKEQITPLFNSKIFFRPVIQKIQFGRSMNQEKVMTYLTAIDELCHDKLKFKNPVEAAATGRGKPRLASPLWISFINTDEGVCPVYTFVNAIDRSKQIDADCKVRDEFVDLLEKRTKRR
ncbi:hypothetical protein C0033_14825 [Clostridium sp. chh4-2]|uniref:RAMP superfamily CRISPR-associated protein n=1 Tax=Clostridium sp. chh4-2 TaxID=2067550 RepID=UPI000CCE5899|nr:hypothetical protein C0033_14825 [Clostridium sp. chh4-2]